MDTAPHWPPQGFNGVVINKPHLENSRPSEITSPVEKREIRAKKEAPLNCPRCNSLNTKFCYYNNYSLSQPRHFCKTCKRYWTQGGSLRNIPVGGASRKNRRSSSSSSSSHHIIPPSNLLIHGESQNPNLSSNHLSLVSSCYLPMICSSASTNLLFPHEELKPPVTYFSSLESHHYVNGTVHRQEMTTAKFDGLFDRVQGDDHPSIGFGMNNGMFGGEGSLWQL